MIDKLIIEKEIFYKNLNSKLGDVKPLLVESVTDYFVDLLKTEEGRDKIERGINLVLEYTKEFRNVKVPLNPSVFTQKISGKYNLTVSVSLTINSAKLSKLNQNNCELLINATVTITYSSPDLSGDLSVDVSKEVTKNLPTIPDIKSFQKEETVSEQTPAATSPYNSLRKDKSPTNIANWIQKSDGGLLGNDKEAWAEFAFNMIKDMTVYNQVTKILGKDTYKYLKSFMTTSVSYYAEANNTEGVTTIDNKYKQLTNQPREIKNTTQKVGLKRTQTIAATLIAVCNYNVVEINSSYQRLTLQPKSYYLTTTRFNTPYGGNIRIKNNEILFNLAGFAGLPSEIGVINFGKITKFEDLTPKITTQVFNLSR